MKSIIITGATSFIGIHLINRLLNYDVKIYAVARPSSPRLMQIPTDKKIVLLKLNMNDYKNLDNIIPEPCNCMVHLAWEGTRGSDRMDVLMQKKNYNLSMDAVKAALRLKCKTILSAGSQAEYGNCNDKITEDTVCKPNTEYGKAKLKFYESALILCRRNNVIFKEPRFFSLYGPGDYEKTMINSILNNMINNRECELTQCVQLWNFLYIDDAVDGIIKLIQINCADGAYNFGSQDTRALKSFIEEMYNITKSKSKLVFGKIPYTPAGVINLDPVIDKMKNETGWKPVTPYYEGIKKIIATL